MLDEQTAVILVDHGSKRPAANALLDDVAQMFSAVSAAPIVEIAHMELAEPSLAHAFKRCVERGAARIVIHPYFLAPGRHSTEDIPRMAEEAAQAYPGVSYVVSEPLGLDTAIGGVIQQRVEEALATLGANRHA